MGGRSGEDGGSERVWWEEEGKRMERGLKSESGGEGGKLERENGRVTGWRKTVGG